ncbi:MAG: hypothetical protein HC853_18565 [Anaerolineae bacterium]|nr:hypothetical protein [Anaerolineae bacterium]
MQFGFTRINSRTNTQPPVPVNQDMVIDQGVDNWLIIVQPGANINRPPQAVDDVFIVNGYLRSLPIYEFFDVTENDRDPDLDYLEVITITQPTYGSTSLVFRSTVLYELNEARATDSFRYTLSDGRFRDGDGLTDTTRVDVYFDCACTVLCLTYLELPTTSASLHDPVTDTIDLPLIYRFRNQVLKPTQHGWRYVDMYYKNNPEILVNILMNETLRAEAVTMIELWQDNLRSLTDGDGSAVITQAQLDALSSFLSHLSSASSSQLQSVIAGELQRVGPLDGYAGSTMREAKRRAIGDATVYLPLLE